MCFFNVYFSKQTKIEVPGSLQRCQTSKAKKEEKGGFQWIECAIYKNMFLKTSKNSEIRVKKEGEKIKEKVS